MNEAIAHVRESDKVRQTLAEHLRSVAELAGAFAAKAGLSRSGNLVGLLHDLGKYSKEFQDYIKSAQGFLEQDHDDFIDARAARGKIDHSTAGAQHIWRHYEQRAKNLPYAHILALCVASHHSGLIDCLSPEGEHTFRRRMHKEEAHAHLAACLHEWDAAVAQAAGDLLTPQVMEELYRCAKGIDRRTRALLPHDAAKPDMEDNHCSREVQRGLIARFLLSCLLDADRIDSAEFEDLNYKALRARMPHRPWRRLIERLEKHLAGFGQKHPVDALRREISANCRKRAEDDAGLFTLTVPTGGGKTLAALRFALHHAQSRTQPLDRVIYVVPYTSIIDQNAQTAREILETGEEPGSIVLEHHSDILPERESPQNKILAENWEAPVVFTTMVQFLESLFGSGTRPARRMHNLARSVIIFDEIQALPLRCMHLFCNALTFLIEVCGSTAVLCTATQPLLGDLPRPLQGQLALKPEREIMPNVVGLFADLRRVDFFDHCDSPMSAEEIAALALEELHASGSCLVVCNTKTWAERVYAACCKQWRGARCYLSTNLCPAHRMKKLDALKKSLGQKTPTLCVSTQLIECGVDLSFGAAIRFAAGLDSILQTAGRCNRHGETRRGRVHIVTVRDESLDLLRDIREGRDIYLHAVRPACKEQSTVSDFDLNRPEIIDLYFQRYFYRRKNVMAYSTPAGFIRDDTLLNILGVNDKAPGDMPHPGMLRQSFTAASSMFRVIDSPTRAVIVPYGEGEDIIAELSSDAVFSRKRELLRAAQRCSVNLFPNVLDALFKQGAVHDLRQSGILALSPEYYDGEEFGVILEPRAAVRTPII